LKVLLTGAIKIMFIIIDFLLNDVDVMEILARRSGGKFTTKMLVKAGISNYQLNSDQPFLRITDNLLR
jgi:hypothetical protein